MIVVGRPAHQPLKAPEEQQVYIPVGASFTRDNRDSAIEPTISRFHDRNIILPDLLIPGNERKTFNLRLRD